MITPINQIYNISYNLNDKNNKKVITKKHKHKKVRQGIQNNVVTSNNYNGSTIDIKV